LLLISLAFVHREEKIEQEKGKGAKQKINPQKIIFFGLSFFGFSFAPQRLSLCVEDLKQVHQG
jgi:hypothetical protein